MKGALPQGQRFSSGSRRSGRQTKSEVICLTPSRFHLFESETRVTDLFFVWPRTLCSSVSFYSFLFCKFSMFLLRRLKMPKVPPGVPLQPKKIIFS
jgi:hypothetical protein